MRKRVRRAIRDFVVWTTPLIPGVYLFLYSQAVKVLVWVLQRTPHVSSIYLTGGLVRGECTPGYSDIDLILVHQGGRSERERIEKTLRWLSKLIPPFVFSERSLYSHSELLEDLGQDLYLRFKFSPSSRAIRLLFGSDLSSHLLAEESPRDRRFLEIGLGQFLWAQVIKLLIHQEGKVDPLKSAYQLAKLRRDCLKFESGLALPLAFDSEPDEELIFSECEVSLRRTLRSKDREGTLPSEVSGLVGVFDLESQRPHITTKVQAALKKLCDFAEQEASEEIESIRICPFQLLGLEEDNICAFLTFKHDLSLNLVRRIQQFNHVEKQGQSLRLYALTDSALLSLSWKDDQNLSTVLMTPLSHPEIYLYLNSKQALIWGGSSALRCFPVRREDLEQKIQKWIEVSERKIDSLLKRPNLVRLPNLDFQSFFWQALQVRLAIDLATPSSKAIPTSSVQIFSRVCDEGAWLDSFFLEYQKDLEGQPSRSEAYFSLAVEYLRGIYGR